MPTLKDGNRPRISLLDDPAREKANASHYTKNPEALAEYEALLDVIYPVVLNRTLSDRAIDVINSALQSRFKIVWEKAGSYLIVLSHYFPKALETCLMLTKSKAVTLRLRVVQSQWTATLPEPHLTDLLRAAIRDESAEVRMFAAIRCGDFRRKDLLGLLQEQLAREISVKVKQTIEFTIETINIPATKIAER